MTNLAKYSTTLFLKPAEIRFIVAKLPHLGSHSVVEVEVLWCAFSLSKPEQPCVPVSTQRVMAFEAWLAAEAVG